MKIERIELVASGDPTECAITVVAATETPTGRRVTTFQMVGELSAPIDASGGVSLALGKPVKLTDLASLIGLAPGALPAGAVNIKAVFGRVDRYERRHVDIERPAPEPPAEAAEEPTEDPSLAPSRYYPDDDDD